MSGIGKGGLQRWVSLAESEMKDANLEKATVDGINSNQGIKFAKRDNEMESNL